MEQLDGDNKYDAGEHGLQVFAFLKFNFSIPDKITLESLGNEKVVENPF